MRTFALLLIVLAIATVNAQWLVKSDLKVDKAAVLECIEDCLGLCKDGIDAISKKDYTRIPAIIEEATKAFADCKKAAEGDMLKTVSRFMMNDKCVGDLKNMVNILSDLVSKGMSFQCDMGCLYSHVMGLQAAAQQASFDCTA